MRILSAVLLSVMLARVSAETSSQRRFEQPLRVDDESLATIQSSYPWARACASDWMPWVFTFEEWRSYRSPKLLNEQKIDAAAFKVHQQAVAKQLTSHGKTVLVTLSVTLRDDDFLIVVSCAEKLDRYPKGKEDLPSGIQKMLLKKWRSGWLVVDVGIDLPYDDPIVKKMLSITYADLGIID
jgi:hypothetical protein